VKKRSQYPNELKARVALEALKEEKTIAQISSEYEVHSNMVSKWKKHLKENIAAVFTRKNESKSNEQELIDKLYRQIGKSQMEIDWLKKKLSF